MKKLLFIILNIVATLTLHAEEKDIDSYIPINLEIKKAFEEGTQMTVMTRPKRNIFDKANDLLK